MLNKKRGKIAIWEIFILIIAIFGFAYFVGGEFRLISAEDLYAQYIDKNSKYNGWYFKEGELPEGPPEKIKISQMKLSKWLLTQVLQEFLLTKSCYHIKPSLYLRSSKY